MKKYKVYIIYHFVGGTNITLVEDYKGCDVNREFVSKFMNSILEVPYNSQTREKSSVTINMANVTTIWIDFKEIEDEDENKTNS